MSPTVTSSEQIYCSTITTNKAKNTKIIDTSKITITAEKNKEGYSKGVKALSSSNDDDSDGTTTPPSSDEDDYPDQVIIFCLFLDFSF